MRKILFWAHLIAGTTAAVVILIMSVTGVLLMYERQMIEWADRQYRSVEAGQRRAPETLLQGIVNQTGKAPEALTLRSDPAAPVEFSIGPKVFYADAYSGRVLGEGSASIRRFFRAVTEWHRYLSLQGANRPLGKSITGAANLMFLGLALTGMYLWLPRKWSWSSVRAVVWFRGGLSGKARDFNWHNTIGIWSTVPLVFVILGAAVISYPWMTNLVYRVAGSPTPSPAAPVHRPAGQPSAEGLDRAVEQARGRVPGWQSIVWRPSAGERISLNVAESHRGRVDLRSMMIVNRATGEVIEHEQFASYSRGRQWRLWLRFIHTGEALGVGGQTIAGIVSAGAAVLVWTGLALTWRRFRAWRSRAKPQPEPDLMEV